VKIKLELISDLCSGSGESTAGIVDSEIVFDQYGIPYIPARRLKGCLREAAMDIKDALGDELDQKVINDLFGVPGQEDSGDLWIENGKVENYDAIVKPISMGLKNETHSFLFHPSYIKQYYTSLKDQTTIDRETGAAQENTLRRIRVINRGNVFYFDVKVKNETEKDLLAKCCKVLRHIGLGRTRGLGEVYCELIDDEQPSSEAENHSTEKGFLSEYDQDIPDNCKVVARYEIKLLSQVMIPGRGQDNENSLNYIPGSTILGYFANQYIKQKKLDTEYAHQDKRFCDIFLNGSVIFSNAYICDEDGASYIPCPASIVKVKDKEEYFDRAWEDENNSINDQVKSVGDTFIRFTEYGIILKDPDYEITYHHQRPKDRSIGHVQSNETDGGGQFYQFQVLSSGQRFKGKVIGLWKDLKELLMLLPHDGIIHIGRSKSAQYGKASMHFDMDDIKSQLAKFNGSESESEDIIVRKDDQFAVILLSPMILINQYGFWDPDPQLLCNILAEDIGNIQIIKSFVKVTTVSGFNAKWMLPRSLKVALDKGTTIVFRYKGEEPVDITRIMTRKYGLMTNEGFGDIEVCEHESLELRKGVVSEQKSYLNPEDVPPEVKKMILKILDGIFLNQIRNKAAKYAKEKYPEVRLSNTTVGKLILMLNGSIGMENFRNKVYQIKDEEKRKKCLLFLFDEKEDKERNNEKKSFNWNFVERMINQTDIFHKLDDMSTEISKDFRKHFNDNREFYFREFYKSALIQMKYEFRKEENQDNE